MKYTLSPNGNDDEDNPLSLRSLPTHIGNTGWSQAISLVNDPLAIVLTPGDCTDYHIMLNHPKKVVLSVTTSALATSQQRSVLIQWPMLRIKSDCVPSFVRWYKSLKTKPNFTTLSEHGKPSGSGKKP